MHACISTFCMTGHYVLYMYMYIVCSQLEREGSLSAEELARLAAVSITLATERLVWLTFAWRKSIYHFVFSPMFILDC